MCGICGWIQLNGKRDIQTSTTLFEPMNTTLAHRGPDDHGAVVFDDAVLGKLGSASSISMVGSSRSPMKRRIVGSFSTAKFITSRSCATLSEAAVASFAPGPTQR
jgi:asparagine synthetase B (glutamine-hydrolysing)